MVWGEYFKVLSFIEKVRANKFLIGEYRVFWKSVFWYILRSVTDFILNKVPRGLTAKNFRKCLETLLNGWASITNNFHVVSFLIEKRNTKNSLWWHVLCRASVMLVVKVTKKFFNFANKSRRLLLKLPRNNQSLLIHSQVAEQHLISFYRISPKFSCVFLQSSFCQSFSVLILQGWSENILRYQLKR